MIWDMIRDFFVQYIFGGYDSLGNNYTSSFGYVVDNEGNGGSILTNEIYFQIDNTYNDGTGATFNYISLGDWLSTTATIITMIAFVIGIIAFMVWLFKLVGNLIILRH